MKTLVLHFFILLTVLLTVAPSKTWCQLPGCDGQRYFESVFETVDSTVNIKYGQGNTFSGTFQELFLDIYEPAGDTVSGRPAIVLAFGGSFIEGTRQDLSLACRKYAQKGYVAVTIDYRLYDGAFFPLPAEADIQDVVIKAVSDMKAAVRFLREDAATTNQYSINPDLIFVGGVSAGAITAAHVAMMDSTDAVSDELRSSITANGGWQGNSSTNTSYSSEVKGLLNFSGAISDAQWIDVNDPPFFSVHEEFDPIVPYGKDFATIFGIDLIYVEGSEAMHRMGDSVGLANHLITITGSSEHTGYFIGNTADEYQDSVLDASALFLHNLFCDPIINTSVQDYQVNESMRIGPNPFYNKLYFQWDDINIKHELTIKTISGKTVYQSTVPANGTIELNANLPDAVYAITVSSQHSIHHFKLLKTSSP